MIRQTQGDSFLLVTQHDHALLAGKFAERIGNGLFARPTPFQAVVDGVALHDTGWPIHDDAPTLNQDGIPLHVLESPPALAMHLWAESARRAAETDPYAGLLVSLHVTALSQFARSQKRLTSTARPKSAAEQFELNKFQQKQFEHQENFRRQLDMRTDLPLHNGLAELGVDDAEDLLLFNFGLLQLLDRISLDLCSGGDLFESIEDVYPQPGDSPVTVRIRHAGPRAMTLSPWPFAAERLEFEVPCRRVPAMRYADVEAFRAMYRAAPTEPFGVSVAAF